MCRFYLWAFISLLVLPLAAKAQDTERTIRGHVRNDSTGAFLQGAEVRVDRTDIRTLTERDGGFSLTVPASVQELRVSYTGFDEKVVALQPGANGSTSLDVSLTSSVYQLEHFTVMGQREGNAASITQQKNAPNIVNVVSTEAFGNVADGNIGNFMQRLPGVAAIRAEGDIIGVGLRGIPPNQSMISVDGTRMAAAVAGSAVGALGGDRAPQIDRIPSEFIKEVVVSKALTPDMDADGLGGSANLITKSAFDFNRRVISYRAASVWDAYRSSNPLTPALAFTMMDKIGPKQNIGYSFSSSYVETQTNRDYIAGGHSDADARNTQARMLDDSFDRVRWGWGGRLEYRPSPTTKLSFGAFYSNYASDTRRYNRQAVDSGSRLVADYNVVSRSAIEAGATPKTTTGQNATVAPGYNTGFTEMLNANWINQAGAEIRRGNQYNFDLGGETLVGDVKLSAKAAYSPASYSNNFIGTTATMHGIGMAIDTSKSQSRPVFTQTYGATIGLDTDFNQYTAQFFEQPDHVDETIGAIQTDAEWATKVAGAPLTLKAGVKYRNQDRKSTTWRPTWNYVGADGVAGFNVATQKNDDNLAQFLEPNASYGIFNGLYPRFRNIDIDKVSAAFQSTPGNFAPVGTSVSRVPPEISAEESVTGEYLQGTLTLGKVLVTGGVRAEQTSVDAVGSLDDPKAPSITKVGNSGDYGKLMPSLHIRYEPLAGLQLRASYSTSIGRPNISDITPSASVVYGNGFSGLGTVTQSNPALKPQYSQNYDASAEYYFEPVGVVSVGVFHKSIRDFINTVNSFVGSGPDNGFGGSYAGFDYLTKQNVSSATVSGFELNYSQQLANLSPVLSGVGVFANYTQIKTEGQFDNGATQLVNFVPRTGNAGLSWRWRGLEARASYNYKSAFISNYNVNPVLITKWDKEETVDATVQYAIRPAVTLFVDVVNLFNKSPNQFNNSDSNRVQSSAVYGTRITAGISGRF